MSTKERIPQTGLSEQVEALFWAAVNEYQNNPGRYQNVQLQPGIISAALHIQKHGIESAKKLGVKHFDLHG